MAKNRSCPLCKKNEGVSILLTRHSVANLNEDKQKDVPIFINKTVMTVAEEYSEWQERGPYSHTYMDAISDASDGQATSVVEILEKMYEVPAAKGFGYVQASLREGYLYVYDERLSRWQAYYITSKGYYIPFDIREKMSEALKDSEACHQAGHILRAMTITVSKQSKIIRFKFSDVEWTDKVITKYSDVQYREKHMRSIDIDQWLYANNHQGCSPITSLSMLNRVANFFGSKEVTSLISEGNVSTDITHFNFLDDEFSSSGDVFEVLTELEEETPNLGIIVSIVDMVGLALDINAQLNAYNRKFEDSITMAENISLVIDDLAHTIKENTDNANVSEAQRIKQELSLGRHPYAPYDDIYGDIPQFIPESMKNRFEQMAELSKEELAYSANTEWAKYERYVDKLKFNATAISYENKLKKKEKSKTYVSLQNWYVDVLSHEEFSRVFKSIYDDEDIYHGLSYVSVLSACIAGAAENPLCFEYFKTRLSEPMSDDHFIINAMFLNQNKMKTQLQMIGSVDWQALPWVGLIDSFDKMMGKYFEQAYSSLSILVGNLAGPLMALLGAGLATVNKALIMLGVMSKMRIDYHSIDVLTKNLIKDVTRMSLEILQEEGSPLRNQTEIKKVMKTAEMVVEIKSQAVPKHHRFHLQFLGLRKNLSGVSTRQGVVDAIDLSTIQAKSISAVGLPGLIALVSSIFQYGTFMKTWDSVTKETKKYSVEFAESVIRLGTSFVGIGVIIGQGVADGIQSWQKIGSQKLGRQVSFIRSSGVWNKLISKKLFLKASLGLAIINGGWDIYNGFNTLYKGRWGEGVGMVLSGSSTIIAARYLLMARVPVIGWIMLAISVISTIYVLFVKDDELQIWINKSCLGLHIKETSFQSEGRNDLKELEKIFTK